MRNFIIFANKNLVDTNTNHEAIVSHLDTFLSLFFNSLKPQSKSTQTIHCRNDRIFIIFCSNDLGWGGAAVDAEIENFTTKARTKPKGSYQATIVQLVDKQSVAFFPITGLFGNAYHYFVNAIIVEVAIVETVDRKMQFPLRDNGIAVKMLNNIQRVGNAAKGKRSIIGFETFAILSAAAGC